MTMGIMTPAAAVSEVTWTRRAADAEGAMDIIPPKR
jgi:hypothetical protein